MTWHLPFDPKDPPRDPPYGADWVIWEFAYELLKDHQPDGHGFCMAVRCRRTNQQIPCEPQKWARTGFGLAVRVNQLPSRGGYGTHPVSAGEAGVAALPRREPPGGLLDPGRATLRSDMSPCSVGHTRALPLSGHHSVQRP